MTLSIGYKLIAGFVALIIGIVLISTVATQSLAVTDKTNVLNESNSLISCVVHGDVTGWTINESDSACNFTVTNNPTGWKVTDCQLSSVAIDNSTVVFTEGTDYNLFASSGVVQMLNVTSTQNSSANGTFSDYTYCGDGYLNSAFGRSSQNLVPGFFALALLAVSIGLFYSVGRETGII